MKVKIITVIVTALVTVVLISLVVWFFFGFNIKPSTVMSTSSPDRSYEAFVVENPSPDPPNQSLLLSKTGTGEFRMITRLSEDIDSVKEIRWTDDGNTVVFITGWSLVITDVQSFETKMVSLNPDWWQWHPNGKTFSSSGRSILLEQFDFTGTDSLRYKTNLMDQPRTISLSVN